MAYKSVAKRNAYSRKWEQAHLEKCHVRQKAWRDKNKVVRCQKKVQNRLARKRKAVDYLGGKCSKCGYKKCLAVLDFHHRDPKTKAFNVSWGILYSWERVKAELDKCDLLCKNCHYELEFGV